MTAAHTSVCAPVHTMLQRVSSLRSAPGVTLISCALQSASCFHQHVHNRMVLHLLRIALLVPAECTVMFAQHSQY